MITVPGHSIAAAMLGLALLLAAEASASEGEAESVGNREAAASDLFSDVSLAAVFATAADQTLEAGGLSRQGPVERGQRLLSTGQLAECLRRAGLEAQISEADGVNVSLTRGSRRLEIMLSLTSEQEQILATVMLAELEGSRSLPPDRLLALLAANEVHRPASFAYHESRRQLQLQIFIPNDLVTPRQLSASLRQLLGIAQETASLWEFEKPAAGSPDNRLNTVSTHLNPASVLPRPAIVLQPKPATSDRQQAVAAPPAGFVGKWSATRSDRETFALQLNADGSFSLEFLNAGSASRSTGTFQIGDGQLRLTTGDGGTFTGAIGNLTKESFEFTPGNKPKLVFRRVL